MRGRVSGATGRGGRASAIDAGARGWVLSGLNGVGPVCRVAADQAWWPHWQGWALIVSLHQRGVEYLLHCIKSKYNLLYLSEHKHSIYSETNMDEVLDWLQAQKDPDDSFQALIVEKIMEQVSGSSFDRMKFDSWLAEVVKTEEQEFIEQLKNKNNVEN